MNLAGNWSGKIIGTNKGNIHTEIAQYKNKIFGKLHINDLDLGVANYYFEGTLQNDKVEMVMHPLTEAQQMQQSTNVLINGLPANMSIANVSLGVVKTVGTLKDDNLIEGNWSSSIGTAGTFLITRDEKTFDDINNNAFVIMAIKNKPEEDDILNAIKRACNEKNINATRVDDTNHSGKITPLIINGIRNSKYIICDITEERPNVYYELGYAHGHNKEVILLAKEGTKLHFDIKDYNVIFYSSLSSLEKTLKERFN